MLYFHSRFANSRGQYLTAQTSVSRFGEGPLLTGSLGEAARVKARIAATPFALSVFTGSETISPPPLKLLTSPCWSSERVEILLRQV